ncbi:hypothetical protein ES703_124670 [subsurface metagenome]
MIVRIKILTVLLFCTTGVFAQQMSVVTLFDQNLTYINPAATGNQEALTAGFFYRSQWTGFEGTPSTQFFSAHAPLKNPKVALGVMLEHESIGSINYTGVYFNYAYRFTVGPGKLSLGLKFGLNSGSQKTVSLRNTDDQAFNEKSNTFFVPNAGFGALYSTEMYWASFSIPRFFGYKSDASGAYKMSHDFLNYEYYFAGGGKMALPSEFSIEPSVLLVYSAVHPFQAAVNAIGMYKNTYRAGIGYRYSEYGEAFILIIGYNLNRQFSLGYSYDINIGKISDYTSGSHEINVQYKFGYSVNASNPRRF